MEKEIRNNEKEAKKLTTLLYTVPLVLAIIVAFIYIFTQLNFLLIIFAILMFVILFGWDGSTRTCPECKKWNAIIWTKVDKETREVQSKNKGKKKSSKEKITKMEGTCKYCKKTVNTERKRFI